MFDEHLELFGEAAGKDASQRLTFAVQSVGPGDRWREATMRTIATAHIASDELRRAGMYNPHLGAAMALPLRAVPEAWPATSPPLPRGAALHCYVHAGYHYQSSSRRHSLGGAAGGSPALNTRRMSHGGVSAAVGDDSTDKAGGALPPSRRARVRVQPGRRLDARARAARARAQRQPPARRAPPLRHPPLWYVGRMGARAAGGRSRHVVVGAVWALGRVEAATGWPLRDAPAAALGRPLAGPAGRPRRRRHRPRTQLAVRGAPSRVRRADYF